MIIVLVFWLDWNAVKDVVGSGPLAAGGENQSKQDPPHPRSSPITVDKTTTRVPQPGRRNRERPGLWLPLGTGTFKPVFEAGLSCPHALSLTHTHNWFVTGIAVTPAAAETVPPEPAQVQPSCDPHGRSEAEESL